MNKLDCILWSGRNDGRYGIDGGFLAHRRAWEREHKQPVPSGMVIHHTCENTLCINPYHLIAMTHSEHKHLHPSNGNSAKPHVRLRDTQLKPSEITDAIDKFKGNKRRAAIELQISRTHLYSLMSKFGLR